LSAGPLAVLKEVRRLPIAATIANGVTVKMYVRNSTGLNGSQHDLARLHISYVP
jgi:hypothetical protein